MLVKYSTRLPNKNFREYEHVPLYYYTLRKVASAVKPDKIWIVTSSDTHRKVSLEGINVPSVEVIRRPSEYEPHDVPHKAIVDWLRAVHIPHDEHYLVLQATSPNINVSRLLSILEKLQRNWSASIPGVFSVNPYTAKPDGNWYIGLAPNEMYCEGCWISAPEPIYNEASDIDDERDWVIASAITDGRVMQL